MGQRELLPIYDYDLPYGNHLLSNYSALTLYQKLWEVCHYSMFLQIFLKRSAINNHVVIQHRNVQLQICAPCLSILVESTAIKIADLT